MPYVSDLLTAAAASVTGTPTPTRSWQWLRGSTLISGATSSTYTVSEDDIGSAISVRQIETNIAGVDTATSAATAAVQAFEPIALFGAGEEGAWYDPSDLSTLYQDSAGTTPVTAAGQPVGLMLDKSKGLTLGSELAVSAPANGATYPFDTLATSGPLITSAIHTPGVNAGATWDLGSILPIGTILRVSINISINSGSAPRLVFTTTNSGSGGYASNNVFLSNGQNDLSFRITAGATRYLQIGGDVSSFDFAVNSISVRELPGNHATQSTSTARPTLAVTGTTPATLGSELVTNGTFDTSSDWTLGTGWTITGGEATAATAPGSNLDQSLTTTAGKYYVVEYSITSYTSGDIRFRFTGVANINGVLRSSVGTFSEVVFASSVNNVLRFTDAGGGFTGSIDNVSVKEVITWADPKYYLDFDGVDDWIRTTFASAQAQPNTASTAFRQNATPTTAYVFDGIQAAYRNAIIIRNNVSNSTIYSGTELYTGVNPGTSTRVYTATFNGLSSNARVDGASLVTGDAGPNGVDGVTLGARHDASVFLDGRIYGFVGVNRTLTTAEIEATESYLATKSGVTLP